MKDKILNFVEENKKTIVQVSGALVGGLIGLGLTIVVLNASADEVIEIDDFDSEK